VSLCWIFGHVLYVGHEVNRQTRLVGCRRCTKRFVMNDTHQAFLRYDNDASMRRDLMSLYPNLRETDF